MEMTKEIKKICLCYLGSKVNTAVTEPLGIETIAGAIRFYQPKIHVELYNQQIHGTNGLIKIIQEDKPDIVGFSIPNGAIVAFEEVEGILERKPKINEKPIFVLGGIEPSFHEELVLKVSPDSYVIKGEGDNAIVEFIDAITGRINLSEVSNLVYIDKNQKQIIRNRIIQPDVSKVPLPVRDLALEAVKLGGYAYIETSRGCSWGHCTFCLRHDNEKHRRFPLERVLADIQRLNSLGIKKVGITDEEFLGNDTDWLLAFSEEIIKRDLDIKFTAACQSISIFRENQLVYNEERLKVLRKLNAAGLTKLFLGVDSGAKGQLKRYAKSASVNENFLAIQALKSLQIDFDVGFITFDPLMELNEVGENIKFIEETNTFNNMFTPFHGIDVRPGSAYAKMLENKGLLGELNPVSYCYDYQFIDENVGHIYLICKKLLDKGFQFQFNLSQITNTSDNSILNSSIREIRKIQFNTLKTLYALAEKSQLCEEKLNCIEKEYDENTLRILKRVLQLISKEEGIKNTIIKSIPREHIYWNKYF
jgi:radical SAM superfamily enzyme YgiQ (UPF0313 family)